MSSRVCPNCPLRKPGAAFCASEPTERPGGVFSAIIGRRPAARPKRRARGLAQIIRKRAIGQHPPHIFKAGQKQPPEFRIQVEGIFGPQPVEAIVRMLTKHRVERRELQVGWKRLFI